MFKFSQSPQMLPKTTFTVIGSLKPIIPIWKNNTDIFVIEAQGTVNIESYIFG